MFPRRCVRIGAVMIGVLAVSLASPAGAAGWGTWDWADGLRPRVFAWLGLDQELAVLKDCSHIDPDGRCIKGGPPTQRPTRSVRDEGQNGSGAAQTTLK
jgi:hypothetical protein